MTTLARALCHGKRVFLTCALLFWTPLSLQPRQRRAQRASTLIAVAVVVSCAAAVVSTQSETSYQIRTANSAEAFAARIEGITKQASSEWAIRALRSQIGGAPELPSAKEAGDWIDGDIETRFKQSPLVPLRGVLAKTARDLVFRYLQDFSLTLGSIEGRLGAVYGPLSIDEVFNTLKMTERDRAGAALTDVVLSRLDRFADLANSPGVDSVGAIVAYGQQDFLKKDSVGSLQGEAVSILMPATLVSKCAARNLAVEDVVEKSRVVLCHFQDCQTIRPRLP